MLAVTDALWLAVVFMGGLSLIFGLSSVGFLWGAMQTGDSRLFIRGASGMMLAALCASIAAAAAYFLLAA